MQGKVIALRFDTLVLWLMLLFALAFGVGSAGAAFAEDGAEVRFPMEPKNKREAVALQHLNHARWLLRQAAKEIHEARMLRNWPDRDWGKIERNINGYEKMLDSFINPTYRVELYPDEVGEKAASPEVSAISMGVAEVDPYPNGEDLVKAQPSAPGIEGEE